jgi:integrase
MGVTFESAAALWLNHLQTRRRRPIKPATAKTFGNYVRVHIVPQLGSRQVGDVGVAVMREFISQLAAAELSAKTINEIVSCTKSIIASVCDAEGEPLYPRRWDNDKIDLPVVSPAEQHTPTVTRAQLESAIKDSGGPYKYLYALAAGSGLRVGELLAVRLVDDGICTFFDSANAVIHVRQSLFQGCPQAPKTAASIRSVEIPAKLSKMLAQFAAGRGSHLFGNGVPLGESTARKQLAKAIPGVGFHSFRRFFVSHRRATGMPEEILRALVGHATSNITDRYSHFGKDAAQRREWVERCGLGFALPGGE